MTMTTITKTTDHYGRAELNPGRYCGRNDHQYVLEASRLFVSGELIVEHNLYVNARNRAQAASIAKRAGYEVGSVNMIG